MKYRNLKPLSPETYDRAASSWAKYHMEVVRRARPPQRDLNSLAAKYLPRVKRLAKSVRARKTPQERLRDAMWRFIVRKRGKFTFNAMRPYIERFGPDRALEILERLKEEGLAEERVEKNAIHRPVTYWVVKNPAAVDVSGMDYLVSLLEEIERRLGVTRMSGNRLQAPAAGVRIWGGLPDASLLSVPPSAIIPPRPERKVEGLG